MSNPAPVDLDEVNAALADLQSLSCEIEELPAHAPWRDGLCRTFSMVVDTVLTNDEVDALEKADGLPRSVMLIRGSGDGSVIVHAIVRPAGGKTPEERATELPAELAIGLRMIAEAIRKHLAGIIG